MSAFVLKREYALQLPNSYVDIDSDEMEYVDGGGYISHTKLLAYLAAFGFGSVYLIKKFGITKIVSGLKAVITSVKAGFAATGWGIVVSAYIGWKAASFISEVANALDRGLGIKYYWGWTGPCLEAS